MHAMVHNLIGFGLRAGVSALISSSAAALDLPPLPKPEAPVLQEVPHVHPSLSVKGRQDRPLLYHPQDAVPRAGLPFAGPPRLHPTDQSRPLLSPR